MKSNKIFFSHFRVFALFAVMLCACMTSVFGGNDEKPVYGGTLRIGMFNEPTIIHPLYTQHSQAMTMMNLIFSGLIRFDQDDKAVSDLAESWDISENSLVYTFYLRRGVLFHDGVECTAEDVKFSFDAVCDESNKSPYRTLFQDIAACDVMDAHTFMLVLKQPVPSFLYKMNFGILPKHVFQGKSICDDTFVSKPVGTGPFRFGSKNENGEIRLDANTAYYDGRPYLDHILFKPLFNKKYTSAPLFRGDIDMVTFMSFDDFNYVNKDASLQTKAVDADYYYALAYDLNDPSLKDKRVRYAIAHALSQEELINEVLQGQAVPCYGPFHPSVLELDTMSKPFSYDLKKAITLLEDAGFIVPQGKIYREKDGKELTLRITTDSKLSYSKEIVQNIRMQLAKVGINVLYIAFDSFDVLSNEIMSKQYGTNVFLNAFPGGVDADYAAEQWLSRYESQYSMSLYVNHEVDQLVTMAQRSINSAQKQAIYQKVHNAVYADQPVCFLFYRTFFHAVSRRTRNTDAYFSKGMPVYAVKDFYIDE